MSNGKVRQLQQQLRDTEAKFEPLRKQFDQAAWDALSEQAAALRRELFALTGDAYGNPKKKVRETPPDDDRLDARYDSPDEVPQDVMSWVRRHASLLTSDATDAVRWSRIIDTLEDDRYPEGEITLYRAVAAGDDIRPGDWVTTNRKYAEDHLRRHLNGRGRVIELVVDGQDVLVSPTGDTDEAIYAPREFSGPPLSPGDELVP